jgi:hypothetical protein
MLIIFHCHFVVAGLPDALVQGGGAIAQFSVSTVANAPQVNLCARESVKTKGMKDGQSSTRYGLVPAIPPCGLPFC